MKKELKKNLILLAVTILVVLVILEISLRLFYPQKIYNECYEPSPKDPSTWEIELDSKIGWVLRPDYSACRYQPDTNKIIYKTHNS
ncbi:hypothetical protein CMI37_26495 [Candidatus Pacearchaeota archaeon]|nr:hypothetical protein [Candidatus Pacearchaeota archaeon]|tara:strand:+ start:1465 stop:1722 length:258 start_codon:yes stop_codon:yes gene_type:complete